MDDDDNAVDLVLCRCGTCSSSVEMDEGLELLVSWP